MHGSLSACAGMLVVTLEMKAVTIIISSQADDIAYQMPRQAEHDQA